MTVKIVPNESFYCSERNQSSRRVERVREGLFQVWPNPASDAIKLQFFSKVPVSAKLKITDSQGNLLKALTLQGIFEEPISISASDLPNGLYLIQAQTPNHSQTAKVIIIK